MYPINKFFLYILLFSSLNICAVQTTLLIKIPTRSRPDQFFKMLDTYYEYLSHTIPFTFLITCDQDDTSMNNESVIEKLQSYPHLVFGFTNCASKVEAYNQDVNNFDFDILLVAADDIVPVVKNFDVIIFNTMKETFPDFDGVLNINDGTIGRLCNTIPILGSRYYKRFGYIYHPSYKALVCDVELTNVSKILKREKVIDQVLMKHNHPSWGLAKKDNLYKKNETFHMQDKDVFFQRRVNFFDIPPTDIELATPKLWSILICTTQERQASFVSLYRKIARQIQDLNLQDRIEILFFKDKQGAHTIGHKRNILLEKSQGKYVSFIEGEDDIHDQYVELVTATLANNPDCVALNATVYSKDTNAKPLIRSINYKRYAQPHIKAPNHLNPIKRSIAAQFTFSDNEHYSDNTWALQLAESALLQTEATINQPYYFCKTVKSH